MRNLIRIFLVTLITLGYTSCEDTSKSSTCDVANPAEDLSWLKTMIESWEANSTIYTYQYVLQGTYLGQTVFIAANCCPFCDSYFPIFNCEGEGLEGVIFQDIKNLKTIWKPDDSQCTL
ncbi:MAG TPA: hypothetical protein VFU05_06695 [Cyclobacteriaceae bacterium]|nr:hypothetical protein [Cyclobacteriaceae bacterium]